VVLSALLVASLASGASAQQRTNTTARAQQSSPGNADKTDSNTSSGEIACLYRPSKRGDVKATNKLAEISQENASFVKAVITGVERREELS
jgi:hypothetical protein